MAFGDLRGTLSGSAGAGFLTDPLDATTGAGSVSVSIGDLIFVVVGESATLQVTGCTDNLGNTYAAVTAGLSSTSVLSLRAFYSIATNAGSVSAVHAAGMTSGSAAGAICASIYAGPFNAIDKAIALVLDTTAPFTATTTGTLAQADELVCGYAGVELSTGGSLSGATSPFNADGDASDGVDVQVRSSSLVVSATTAQVASFTGSTVHAGIVGVASFKKGTAPTVGTGTASGVGAASGVGKSLVAGVGSATGAATASGGAAAIGIGVGTAAAAGTASGTGKSLVAGVGTAAGVGAASGVVAAVIREAGSAPGIGAASGDGLSFALGTSSAQGVATAPAVGKSIALGIGTAAGAATAAGVFVGAANLATAHAIGTASAIGLSLVAGVGTAAASGTARGDQIQGAVISYGIVANAVGTANGIGARRATGFGYAPAAGHATGVPPVPLSLLPTNATPWELAEERTDSARYPFDTDVIARTKDALLVDDRLLPVLAWERSVDVWYDGQTDTARRQETDKAIALHKLKGTKAGLKAYIELTGAKAIKIDSPPQKAFPGRAMTAAERTAWLARFQQVRTFKYRTRGAVAGAMFFTTATPFVFPSNPASPLAKFAVTINGFEYDGYHSFLWDNGAETALTQWKRTVTETDKTVNEYDWIVLPPNLNLRWFLNQPTPKYFLCSQSPIAERTISVFRDMKDYRDHNEFFTSRTISPGLQPIRIKPERVAERAPSNYAQLFLGTPNAHAYFTLGLAGLHIYDRIYLWEPNRGAVPMPPDARCFFDFSRFHFPPFTSLSKVQVTLNRPPFAFRDFMRGYWVAADMAPLNRLVDAARSASSARDSTLIDTQTHDTVTVAENLFCGEVNCGAQVPI